MWLPLTRPQLGTWPATQACALTGNRTSNALVHRLMLNPLSHTSRGRICNMICELLNFFQQWPVIFSLCLMNAKYTDATVIFLLASFPLTFPLPSHLLLYILLILQDSTCFILFSTSLTVPALTNLAIPSTTKGLLVCVSAGLSSDSLT